MKHTMAITTKNAYNFIIEPRREKMGLRTYANSKTSGKPAHLRSLARGFAVCFELY